jgi:fused signal recognition particle receptor
VISGAPGADAAGLAFDALTKAKEVEADVLLIDTAGRLQNKAHLMEELKKIQRVLSKVDPSAPHSTLLILDGTTGQNAHSQVHNFQEIIGLTGLVITKLDGTARGGVVVSLAQKFGLPIHAVGVGETADDLRPFTSRDFARNLVGLEG